MIYHDLCNIISLGLKGKSVKINKDLELDKLCVLASKQGISALLFSFIRKELDETSKEYKFLYNSYLATLQKSASFENEFLEICKFAQNNKIELIAYKGSIIKNLYPDKYLRLMGDLDFKINKKDLIKLGSFLKSKQYVKNREFGNHHEYNKKPYFDVELHESFYEKEYNINIFDDYNSYLINYQDFNYVKCFNDTYHLLFLLSHTYQHLVTKGAGIRNYIDMYLLMKSSKDIDYNFIFNKLESIDLKLYGMKTFSLIETIFQENFGFKKLNKDEFDNYLNLLFKGGVYGVYSDYDIELIKLSINKEKKFKYILKRCFPSYSAMRTKYKTLSLWYMNLFLPFYYIIRIFSFLFKSKDSLERIKLLNENCEEIKKNKAIYYAFGIKKI